LLGGTTASGTAVPSRQREHASRAVRGIGKAHIRSSIPPRDHAFAATTVNRMLLIATPGYFYNFLGRFGGLRGA